jgi:XTP/dITP diphosphohydrolase
MKEIIIASKNKGKVKEFETLLAPMGFQVQSLLDYPHSIDVEETGTTFEENAILKAETIANMYQRVTIADDSGLVIDYLGGKPGIYSARYAGPEKNDQANMVKVLEELSDVEAIEDRTARFACALALATPGEKTKTVVGFCEGFIAKEPSGENGFGYDPIFIVRDLHQTMAELTKEEKNKISHRANALKKLTEVIKQS